MGCGPSGERDLPYEKVCIWKINMWQFSLPLRLRSQQKKAQTMFCAVYRLKNKSRFVSGGVVDFAS